MSSAIRQSIIEQSRRANTGHIGSCLSIADILAALYGEALEIPDFEDPERDVFVLSKGHAALALYSALHASGRLSSEELDTYCADGTSLGGHPEHPLPGVELSTGSLGHGLGFGAGVALGARMRGSRQRAFVLVSDAECNEGSTWEAVMFAAHHRLANLIAVVDANGQQALGSTADVMDLEPLVERFAAFGWDVHEVDGHDPDQIVAIVRGLDVQDGPPHFLVARTTFGKGVSYMEGMLHWHYWPMSDEDYEKARAEVAG